MKFRQEEKKEIALIDRLVVSLHGRVHRKGSRFFDELQERQPLMLLLFLDYTNSGDFTKDQLEEILQVLLLLWLFHEEYYGRVFRPVTDPELEEALTTLEQRMAGPVNGFWDDFEPRMLVARIGRRLEKEPSKVMRQVPLGARVLLLMECMAFCACFQVQREENNK